MKLLSSLFLLILILTLQFTFLFISFVQAKERTMVADDPHFTASKNTATPGDDAAPAYDQARIPTYIESVRKSPRDPNVWSQLAFVLPDEDDQEKISSSVTIDGKRYSKRDCYLKSLSLEENRGQAPVWYNLGASMVPASPQLRGLEDDFVVVNGKKYNRLDCFVKSVEIDPKNALAWYNIGTILNDYQKHFAKTDGKISIKGTLVDQIQCYVNAIKINPRLPYAWNNIGTSLKNNKVRATVDGVKYTRRQCFEEELENNPKHGSAWMNVATTLESGKEFAVVDDVKYNKRKCLLNAIRYNPRLPGAWHNLATILHPRDNVTVTIDANPKLNIKKTYKRVVNSTVCEEEALKLEPLLAAAWFGAGTKMKDGEVLNVPDHENNNNNAKKNSGKEQKMLRKYSKRDAYIRAIDIEPQWADPWNNLATVVGAGEEIRIESQNRSFTQKQLLIESINRDPELARTWHNLCNVMGEDETVTVDGGIYTKTGCKARADEIKNTVKPREGEED